MRDGTIKECDATGNGSRDLMKSHSDGEVWGLDVGMDGQNPIVVTTGDDNTLKVWDPVNRVCLRSYVLEQEAGPKRKPGEGASTLASNSPNQQSRAVAINPHRGHIAVAHNDGHFTVRASADRPDIILSTCNQPAEWTECMRYSPDGKWLALGNHDNFIYIYDAEHYKLVNRR
jgi:WD40 repeat protein